MAFKIRDIVNALEAVAPSSLQEAYDNSGLLVGQMNQEVQQALLCLDCTEEVVQEAIDKHCQLVIAHHPIVFSGLKRFNSSNYVQRCIELAIRNKVAIYAIHTNLDNVLQGGVNAKIAERLGLVNGRILQPMPGQMLRLDVYVPKENADELESALFDAGAGQVGAYSECRFAIDGSGSFTPGEGSDPYLGSQGVREFVAERQVSVVLPASLRSAVLSAMYKHHPYEEVAHHLWALDNAHPDFGAGLVGELPQAMSESEFLAHLKSSMDLHNFRYTPRKHNGPIKTVALCGGAGSFLIKKARACADAYVTADVKYHEFFDTEKELLLCDIGHFESERFTQERLAEILSHKFPNFATLFTQTNTNPVRYYL